MFVENMTWYTQSKRGCKMHTSKINQLLAVIGQGYVGLPVAMTAVSAKFNVIGIDLDSTRIGRLQNSDSYIGDVPNDTLKAALESNHYRATTDYAEAKDVDFAIITVPT